MAVRATSQFTPYMVLLEEGDTPSTCEKGMLDFHPLKSHGFGMVRVSPLFHNAHPLHLP